MSNFGYWEFAGMNGLIGGPSTEVTLPDGRVLTVKDPELPAVLQDKFILDGLSHSRQARHDFTRLFPDLDPVSQDRLTTLVNQNPRQAVLVVSDQDFLDAIQARSISAGVRTRLPTA